MLTAFLKGAITSILFIAGVLGLMTGNIMFGVLAIAVALILHNQNS